jgi:hypothetical protein
MSDTELNNLKAILSSDEVKKAADTDKISKVAILAVTDTIAMTIGYTIMNSLTDVEFMRYYLMGYTKEAQAGAVKAMINLYLGRNP